MVSLGTSLLTKAGTTHSAEPERKEKHEVDERISSIAFKDTGFQLECRAYARTYPLPPGFTNRFVHDYGTESGILTHFPNAILCTSAAAPHDQSIVRFGAGGALMVNPP
jgi:hypothetical protein